MSEELIQRGLIKQGIIIGEYEYFPTHSTTIKQYKQAKIIPNKDYGEYEKKRPDGLLIDRRDKSNPKVIFSLEWKKPKEFQTDKQKKEAIEQCNDICQVIEAKIGIITDGIVTYWINPNHPDKKNEYNDVTSNKKRGYSYILNDDKQKVQKKFYISEKHQKDINKFDDETKETYQIIERVLLETTSNNSILKATEKTDPTPLAKAVWQSIYISTKDNPTACLYNVVEIFIFKFLSDLGVLEKDEAFNHLLKMYKEGYDSKKVLNHYATICRKKIIDLFKEGDDGTSIINGTIFVNNDGSPVLSQATLFKDTIQKYAKFGDLRNIEKGFKTKLFETFLKQSKDKSKLGQFFTPRKVVKAMVEMADVNIANFICDPFCGVGGFILEPFQISLNLKNKFIPKNGLINPNIKLLGYDTGREDNEEQRRTIILAKSNMLIYLSDLVEKYPTLNKEFEKIFNNTFHFLSDSNLGTLKEKFEDEDDKPDLILTNPPYITSGMATIRKQIDEEGLSNDYKNSGQGVQGLCLKWIISNLKKEGTAFLIHPDSTFNLSVNKELRNEIKKYCFVNCIISLPIKTFFNTPKKTCILGITKKNDEAQIQDFPVFTYLVSSIGETLDVNRFEIEENDLDKAKNLFNQYKGSKKTFQTDDLRCKIQPFSKFDKEKYWNVDKWWSGEEKIALGITKAEEVITVEEFKERLLDFSTKLKEYNKTLKKQKLDLGIGLIKKSVSLGNTDYFLIDNGERIRKADIEKAKGTIPVYSSSKYKNETLGFVSDKIKEIVPKAKKFSGLCITINADASDYSAFIRDETFYANDVLNVIKIISKEIYPLYIVLELNNVISGLSLAWNNKLYKGKLKTLELEIPIKSNGKFDFNKQKEIADNYWQIEQIKNKLKEDFEEIQSFQIEM